MTTKFNIGDTVIDNKGIKSKIINIIIDNKFGIIYEVSRCSENSIALEYEYELTKAPITREEALAAALKDISERISKRIDVELGESEGCFEVWSKTHNGPYIGFSKEEYHYEE